MGALFKIYKSDGITEITNIKSVVYREAVNTGEYLKPGCVSSASVDVEVFNTQANAVSAGDVIYAYVYDNANNGTLLGKFNCEPKIDTKNSYKFSAYDNALKLNADFSQWLQANQSSFPMTVKALVTAACTAAGVTLGSSSWPLSNENVQAFYTDGLTCRDILSYAAEIAGRFVRCHTDGKVYFDWYASATDAIAPSAGTHQLAYKQDGLEYANYTTTALARVAVHPSGEDDVAYIYPTGVSSGNTLEITNNLLLTGASAALYNAVAQQVYTAVTAVGTYRPMSANLFPKENTIRAGDIVSVTDAQSVSFSSPVTSLTLNASTALIESEGRQEYEASTNPQKALVQLASDIVRINKLKVSWAEIDQAIVNYLTANDVTAQNLTIVDENGTVLATFNSSGIVLGKTGESRAEIDFNSFELVDKNGNTYTHLGDLRGQNGKAEITEEIVSDGYRNVNTQFQISEIISFAINGDSVPLSSLSYSGTSIAIMDIGIHVYPGDTITVVYTTTSPAYYYDFGLRDSSENVGSGSAILGSMNAASGTRSAAIGGTNNKAGGVGAFVAGGVQNNASGEYAFASGANSNASGNMSFAANGSNTAGGFCASSMGLGNKASGNYQLAYGKYCVEDSNGDYVEIVGNGTGGNNRSNARTLDWSGNEVLAGSLTTAGGVVSDSYYTRKVPVPGANTTYLVCRLEDSNGDGRGGVGFITSNNYGEGTRLYHTRNGVVNGLALYVDSNGTPIVNLGQPAAWRDALGIVADYKAGDTVSFPSSGNNSYYQRFHGDWRYAYTLYFFVPLSRSCEGLTATVSGTVYLVTNKTRNSVNLSNVPTVNCFCAPGGVAVQLNWGSGNAPSYGQAQYDIASVQPYGMTITFS